jgi:hypothetical protein
LNVAGSADLGADAADAAEPALDASSETTPSVDDGSAGPCSLEQGCITVPAGWTLIAVDPTQAASCPNGFAQAGPTDVFEGPNVANACACPACTVTQKPDCASGAVKVFYDNGGGACASAGVPSQNNNNPGGQCGTDLFKGSATTDAKFVPPGPTGSASCTAAGQMNRQKVTFASKARVCRPDSPASAKCMGNQCTPQLAAPYVACIQAAGNASCPSPFTSQHDVGTDVAVTCAACTCSATATCSGTMTYYTDVACQNGATPFPADGLCHASGTTQSFSSYKYAGVATVACTIGIPPAAQSTTLVGKQTLCCLP